LNALGEGVEFGAQGSNVKVDGLEFEKARNCRMHLT
jgi:hypothetical protein